MNILLIEVPVVIACASVVFFIIDVTTGERIKKSGSIYFVDHDNGSFSVSFDDRSPSRKFKTTKGKLLTIKPGQQVIYSGRVGFFTNVRYWEKVSTSKKMLQNMF